MTETVFIETTGSSTGRVWFQGEMGAFPIFESLEEFVRHGRIVAEQHGVYRGWLEGENPASLGVEFMGPIGKDRNLPPGDRSSYWNPLN